MGKIHISLISKWETTVTLVTNIGSKPRLYCSTSYFDTTSNHRYFHKHIIVAGIWDYYPCLSLFWDYCSYSKYLKLEVRHTTLLQIYFKIFWWLYFNIQLTLEQCKVYGCGLPSTDKNPHVTFDSSNLTANSPLLT